METSKSCLSVNRRLLPVKLHYLFFMAALACALPFRTVFAKQLGVSATELGVIFCVIPFLRIVTNPTFGFILDYFKKFRLTISLAMILVAISHLSMILIPSKTSHKNLNITENDFYTEVKFLCENETFLQVCDHKLLLYTKYKTEYNSGRSRKIFDCDIRCLDAYENIMDNEIDSFQCSQRMTFDFKVIVNVSSYDCIIRLQKAKLEITGDNVQNSAHIDINDTTVRQLKSNVSSTERPSLLRIQENTNGYNLSDIAIETFKKNVEYGPTVAPRNIDELKKYYETHEVIINVPTNDIINSSCNREFDCKTKKCFTKSQKDEFVAEANDFISIQFWSVFILFAVSSEMFSAVIFMMDAVCYELLKDEKHKYGYQRLFGTIGWGLGALFGGLANQIVSTDTADINYTLGFYLLAILILIDFVPVYQLKVTDLKYSPHIFKDVCFLFTKVKILCYFAVIYNIGILSGFIWNYQFWFMEEIGSSQVLLGLSQTFEAAFEVPCFLVSGWIISKIGHDQCNNITLLCFGLRYLCFVFMYDPWWTLAAALLHGPTFGIFFASITMYAKNEAPPGTEATVQSLIQLSFGGGIATGSILGGIGFDKFGSRTSFIYAAVLSFLMLFVNILIIIVFSRARRKSKPTDHGLSCDKT